MPCPFAEKPNARQLLPAYPEPLLGYTAQNLKLTYAVGYASVSEVDQYLHPAQGQGLRIPQVVIIDCAGMIRAQSPPGRERAKHLEDEVYLRTVLDGLLRESPAPVAPAKQSSVQKSMKNP